jgi:tRNA(Ile)-lysidine synthase
VSSSACAAEEAHRRFAAALDAAGGWEERPRLAVALSGGPDSLALALLARRWAAARGGDAVALILDHGQRPAARAEARLAEAWAMAAGLATQRLALPRAGVLSAAALREARLAALARAAGERGALHLLLGHHLADQAETVLIRALGHSGSAGLAAMAPVRITPAVRLVRPLLGMTPAAARAVLREAAQPWIADPSNDGGGLRARLRVAMADAAGEGVQVRALSAAAAAHGSAATRHREAATALLANAASLRPGGGVTLDRARLAAAPTAVLEAALGTVLAGVSGRARPPRGEALARLSAALVQGRRAVTLGGCRLTPRAQAWIVTVEPPRRRTRPVAAVAEPLPVVYAPCREGGSAVATPSLVGAVKRRPA